MVTSTAPTALKPGTRVERFISVERAAVNSKDRTVELSFASELPYERWWGIEVLDCTAQAVRMGRLMSGAPLLWNHDTSEQIGVVESVAIGADRICRAVVRFGKGAEAEEVFVDVVDGIRRNVSVGYIIHAADLVKVEGDPNTGGGADTYRVTDWEPYEVSLVSVPADPSVGVGRSAADDPRQPITAAALAAPAIAPPQPAAPAPITPSNHSETRTMTTATIEQPAAPALNISAEADAVRKAERLRASEIRALGQEFARFGGEAAAHKALDDGTDVQGFRNLMANAVTAAQKTQVTNLDLSASDSKRFGVMRAIRAMVDRDWRGAGFEKECSDQICKRAGIQEPVNGGFYVPMDVMARRDLTVGAPTAGGNLVATNLLPQNFIDLLRARSVVARLGATMLPGLVGNVAIPKLTGAATGYWLANEATAITETQQTIGQLALTPKTVGAYTEISRLLMLQATPAADALVMNDFAKVIALAVDLAALEGTGASGQPTGISNTAGIGSVTGTTMAYAGIVEFQTDTAAGNALASNSAYVTTPTVAGLLMGRQRFTSTDTPLWVGSVLDGQMGGFVATTTTQVTAASMVFGDFSQVVIGEWGMFELAMNPYANFPAGITGIRAMQSLDIGVRQAAAFSRATSIT